MTPKPGTDWKPGESMVLAQTGNFTDEDILRRPVSTDCTFSGTTIVYYGLLMEMIIHIGVGSDVVCSTMIGNC